MQRPPSGIQNAAAVGHPELTPSLKAILVVTMPGVAEAFKCVMDNISYETNFTLVNLLDTRNLNFAHEDWNICLHEPDKRWNMQLFRMIANDSE